MSKNGILCFYWGFHIYDGVRGIHECKRSTNAVFTRSPNGKNLINEAKPKRGFLFYSATCRISCSIKSMKMLT